MSADGGRRPAPTSYRSRSRNEERPGFTLIEMLVVMFMLAVLTGIMALLLTETLAIERSQAEGFDSILQINALADQFRADVAQADSAPQKWQEFKADPQTLILEMPNARQVVYAWHEGQLHRHAFEKGKSSERMLPVGSGDMEVELSQAPNPKLIRLRLHARRQGSRLEGQSLEIAAALGGDWR